MAGSSSRTKRGAVQLAIENLGIDRQIAKGEEILTWEAMRNAWQRLNEIKDELDEAHELNDVTRITALENEQEDIREDLRKSTHPGGKSRQFSSDHRKSFCMSFRIA
jgi:hypothetical protein